MTTADFTDPPNITYTLPLGTHVPSPQPAQQDLISLLRAENAALRSLLIDVTGQRDAFRQELDRALRERAA